MSDAVRFYFSFRSPYSWLGVYRFQKIVDQLPVAVKYIPCFPQKGFNNDPANNKLKMLYIGRDLKRYTEAYGLKLNWPKSLDTDWIIPHTAYLYAEENNLGVEFLLKAYSIRFEQGLDIGDDDIIKTIAEQITLDPIKTIKAAHDQQYQARVMDKRKMILKDKLFGVPYFVYNDNKYWGNDRLEWLIRDIYQNHDMEIPDLTGDPFLRPF